MGSSRHMQRMYRLSDCAICTTNVAELTLIGARHMGVIRQNAQIREVLAGSIHDRRW